MADDLRTEGRFPLSPHTGSVKRSFEQLNIESDLSSDSASSGSRVDSGERDRQKRPRSESRSSRDDSGSGGSSMSLGPSSQASSSVTAFSDESDVSLSQSQRRLEPVALRSDVLLDTTEDSVPQNVDMEIDDAPPSYPPTIPSFAFPEEVEPYRTSMERFNAFDSHISILRRSPATLHFEPHRSPSPPTLAPLRPPPRNPRNPRNRPDNNAVTFLLPPGDPMETMNHLPPRPEFRHSFHSSQPHRPQPPPANPREDLPRPPWSRHDRRRALERYPPSDEDARESLFGPRSPAPFETQTSHHHRASSLGSTRSPGPPTSREPGARPDSSRNMRRQRLLSDMFREVPIPPSSSLPDSMTSTSNDEVPPSSSYADSGDFDPGPPWWAALDRDRPGGFPSRRHSDIPSVSQSHSAETTPHMRIERQSQNALPQTLSRASDEDRPPRDPHLENPPLPRSIWSWGRGASSSAQSPPETGRQPEAGRPTEARRHFRRRFPLPSIDDLDDSLDEILGGHLRSSAVDLIREPELFEDPRLEQPNRPFASGRSPFRNRGSPPPPPIDALSGSRFPIREGNSFVDLVIDLLSTDPPDPSSPRDPRPMSSFADEDATERRRRAARVQMLPSLTRDALARDMAQNTQMSNEAASVRRQPTLEIRRRPRTLFSHGRGAQSPEFSPVVESNAESERELEGLRRRSLFSRSEREPAAFDGMVDPQRPNHPSTDTGIRRTDSAQSRLSLALHDQGLSLFDDHRPPSASPNWDVSDIIGETRNIPDHRPQSRSSLFDPPSTSSIRNRTTSLDFRRRGSRISSPTVPDFGPIYPDEPPHPFEPRSPPMPALPFDDLRARAAFRSSFAGPSLFSPPSPRSERPDTMSSAEPPRPLPTAAEIPDEPWNESSSDHPPSSSVYRSIDLNVYREGPFRSSVMRMVESERSRVHRSRSHGGLPTEHAPIPPIPPRVNTNSSSNAFDHADNRNTEMERRTRAPPARPPRRPAYSPSISISPPSPPTPEAERSELHRLLTTRPRWQPERFPEPVRTGSDAPPSLRRTGDTLRPEGFNARREQQFMERYQREREQSEERRRAIWVDLERETRREAAPSLPRFAGDRRRRGLIFGRTSDFAEMSASSASESRPDSAHRSTSSRHRSPTRSPTRDGPPSDVPRRNPVVERGARFRAMHARMRDREMFLDDVPFIDLLGFPPGSGPRLGRRLARTLGDYVVSANALFPFLGEAE
ncbi:hypothetical protein JAAARDRAFT_338191 [Jaapia argillacea MUCL 33604]|uniref:Uncharacterized protein n=1 Tax=Jaapia argillacea MUCL 33604 TaxID=933084 RepID=A0A067PKT6_9AGAM|nr:hypothetical protein JAAARDRAFT_338191 [Jaapia argillacea MUCL 33604]